MSGVRNRLVLITGGARSGKSEFAERLVCSASEKRCYIATAPVLDEEMADRVRRHQERRAGQGWKNLEEQLDLPRALRQAVEDGAEAILVDCLTLWINNLMYRNPDFGETEMRGETERLLAKATALPATVVMVISEVGLGLVPENPLGRVFRDCSGRCAQMVAKVADEVHLVVAGIPWRLK